MDRLRVKELLNTEASGRTVVARGWVRTRRDSKNVSFLEVNDGSCLSNLQVIFERGNEALDAELARAQTGASVEITGTLTASPGGKQSVELHGSDIDVIGEAPAEEYPLQKKRHSFEYLREIAHLRPRTNTFGAVTRVRNSLSFAIHRFFQERGFLYIHTPIITGSDAEGAGEMFRVTTLPVDRLLREHSSGDAPGEAEEVPTDSREDFFGRPTFLTVSGQLEAEIYACAMDRVYTFGPTFRAENSNTTRHLAEFWMIEPEIAFCDLECNMDVAEEFLRYILRAVMEECPEDMEFFDKRIQSGLLETLRHVIESPYSRITYREAIHQLQASKQPFEFTPEWGSDLQSEHEKYLTEQVYGGPVIVTDYPKEIKAFYMRMNEDGNTVRAMDMLVPRLGEIMGGSQREERYDAVVNRIAEMGLDERDYWWYLELRRYGSVPHSGFGLGFERLMQYVTGMQNIRDVIPFPRAVGQADF